MLKGPFNWWKHQLHVGMCFQIQRKKSLDCFTNGSNVFGLLKKEILHSMILNFDKIVFIQVQWYFNFFEYIMFGDFFSLKIFVGWKKRHDGNENSLEMVR